MISRVQHLFGDLSESQVDIPFITAMLNDGQVDVARKTGILKKHVQTNAVIADGSYAVPEDFILIQRATYDGRKLTKTSLEEVDALNPVYDNGENTGTPNHYYVYGRTVFLSPLPSASGAGNLDLWYIKTPTPLVLTTDVSELPITYHEDVVRYALARCKELDEEMESAQMIMGDYEVRMINSMSESHDPYEDSYPAVRSLPGDTGY